MKVSVKNKEKGKNWKVQFQHIALDKIFISSKKNSILCSIKHHKELNVDFEKELRNNVDVEKQLKNKLDLLEMILKWIGKLMLIMIKGLKKKMKKTNC